MQRLERASVVLDNIEKNARILGITLDDMLKMIDGEWWKNDVYTVVVRELENRGAHLSIRRNDREPVRDWRDFQEIKNRVLGEECEAVELYPAESRRVDASNQYHLWGSRRRKFRFPLGFDEKLMVHEPDIDAAIGSKQRPFETPANDCHAFGKIVAALKLCEWAGQDDLPDGGTAACCPLCEALESDGEHYPTCALADALRGAP